MFDRRWCIPALASATAPTLTRFKTRRGVGLNPSVLLALLWVGLVACGGGNPNPGSNQPPTARFTAADTVQAGTPLAFDGSASTDPDNDPLSFSWDFGDGSRGGTARIAHIFPKAGSFKVTLTVADGKGGVHSSEKTITVSPPPAPSKTVAVRGLVKGIDDGPLAGVNVSVVGGSATGTTGADGTVTLNLGVGVDVTLRLSKEGYAEQFKVVNLPGNVGEDGYFEARLIPREAPKTLADAAKGGNLEGKDGVKIGLPAGGLLDPSGKPVSGAVQVSMTPVDVTGAALPAFPGRFEGIEPDGSRNPIVSLGTVEFVLSQNGQRLQVAPGKTASLELPLYANAFIDGSVLKVGDKVPLWSLDERSGTWINEGEGTVVASASSPTKLAVQARVAHFGWWNLDYVPDRANPKLRCVNDVPGQYDDIFAQAQICNMLAEIDRGLSGNSTLPGYAATTTIPIGGGVPLPIPAGVKVILKGSALGGSWAGQATVNLPKNSSDEILIPLRPLTLTGDYWTSFATLPGTNDIFEYRILPDSQKRLVAIVSTRRWEGNNSRPIISVQRWNGSAWSKVTDDLEGEVNAAPFACADFVLDQDDNPVVVYTYPVPNTSYHEYFVRRWKPGGWVAVGPDGGKLPGQRYSTCSESPSLAVGADNQPIVAYELNGAAYVRRFDGANWVGMGPSEGKLNGSIPANHVVMVLDSSGNPVVIWRAYNTSDSYALRYKPTPTPSWEAIGPNNGLLPTSLPLLGFYPTSLILDASGNPVAAGAADICSSPSCGSAYMGVAIYRYDGTQWQTSGGHTASPNGYLSNRPGRRALVLDASNHPLMAWVELSVLYVQRWNGSVWTGVGSDSGAFGNGYNAPTLVRDGAGNLLLGFKLIGGQKIEIYRYVP
ncbi:MULTISPECIES: PKD domain-containing protein [unclassified Meiothermus]|uniref:PKD domain-containing protein n=1 Tax=unclassified Meiothermus TaxID=370471 RepID=UPI000D7CE4BF|nr:MULTISPECIES: PKD domain-containing protein [unclassified Meiothermus]PZA06045.1 hypothetical protein DNA98_15420 [Meiothermus sp. Pnk-1]RYM36159.1 PKD domain-containing protein [Meiothermus sp. PNK-Is4]